ncbi:RagB/SusD family nutrient uptake outer membrane protein [Pedobacter lusitanus]|nr:RagB/SusD family nutrient uptake outer membrane protein [Pedobacter lusitanus]
MKKVLYIAVSLVLFGITGCKKQLTEEPKTFIAPEQFFKTDQDAVQGVNGVYFWLVGEYPQRLFQQDLWQILDEDCDAIRRPNSGALNLSANNSGSSLIVYGGFYKGIYNASQCIDKIPKSGTSDLKKRTEGEARFLRALFYYYVTGLFGDAPLITESNYSNTETVKSLPRSPVAEIRKLMISDLTSAIASLPDTYAAADKGRATKGAAQTLLTKVYLWNKDWVNAKNTAQAIKNSGTYTLLPEYADVFSANNEFNKESIFEIDFQKDLLNSYQHGFYSPDSRVGVEPFSKKPWYRSYVPYQSFANSFAPEDKRKAAQIATGYNGTAFATDAANKVSVWFGPKWWRLDADERNSGLDIYVFRYADVLLMLAEAANESGDSQTALSAINEVRQRAGIAPLAGLSQDALRTQLYQERGWELCGEGHRRLDLQRWGKLIESAKSASKAEEPVLSNSYQTFYNLLPVPASEIQKNPALTQNPGY